MNIRNKKILVIAVTSAAIVSIVAGSFFYCFKTIRSDKESIKKRTIINTLSNNKNSDSSNKVKQEDERQDKINKFAQPTQGTQQEVDVDGNCGGVTSSNVQIANRNALLSYLNLDETLEVDRKIKYSINGLITMYKKITSDGLESYYNSNKDDLQEYYGINSQDDLKSFMQTISFLKSSKSIDYIELLDGISKNGETVNCKIKIKTNDGVTYTFNTSLIFTDNYRKLSVVIR